MSIYKTAVNKPVTTALVFIAFAIFGVFSFMKTSIAQYPDFDANVIMVMSSYPGASAADVETNLTKVLENGLNGVSNLKDLTSRSKENISILILEFNYGVDIEEATNDVRDKLDMINSSLPDQATTPVIFKFSADDMPILILSATAEESLPGLDKILDDKVSTPLARVKGVGTVSVTGAPTREIQVYCDPNKLQAYGLSIATVSGIISSENRNVPSGNIDIGSESYSLRIQKEFKDPSELLNIVVGYKNGDAVYLKDVATVRDGEQEKEQEAVTNGRRSAQIVIQKQSGTNTVNVIKGIKNELKKNRKDTAYRYSYRDRRGQFGQYHQQYQLPEGDHHHHIHPRHACGICLPRKMESDTYHCPDHPYLTACIPRVPVRNRQHIEYHINVGPFHRYRYGRR